MSTLPKILFVDDEAAILAGLRNALRLRRSQWEMEFANGGAEAIAALERTAYSVIVSDLRMPVVDGADVLHRACELQPATARILLTGFGDRDALARVMPWSQLVLAKPMGARDIAAVVARACEVQAVIRDAEALASAARFGTLDAPATFAALAALRFDDRTDIDVVCSIFEGDPVTTNHVLALAQSSALGEAPPSSMRELAARFDLDTLTPLALFAHLVAQVPDRPTALIDHALAMAIATRAAVHDPALAYEAFAAGLLHDVGKLACEPRSAQLGVQVLGRCRLPLTVLEAIAYQSDATATPGTVLAALREAHENTAYPAADRT